eukprot:3563736-Karenia_brevis.AAC.1
MHIPHIPGRGGMATREHSCLQGSCTHLADRLPHWILGSSGDTLQGWLSVLGELLGAAGRYYLWAEWP